MSIYLIAVNNFHFIAIESMWIFMVKLPKVFRISTVPILKLSCRFQLKPKHSISAECIWVWIIVAIKKNQIKSYYLQSASYNFQRTGRHNK